MRSDDSIPVALELRAALQPGSFHRRLQAVLHLVCSIYDVQVLAWRSSLLPDHVIPGDATEALDLARSAGRALMGVELELSGGVRLLLSREEECIFVSLITPEPCPRCVGNAWALCAALAADDLVQSALLERLDDPLADTLADLPLVRRGSHLTVATEALIEEHVGSLDEVLALPWQKVERVGRTVLLGRGMEALEPQAFLESIWSHHAALASLVGMEEEDEDEDDWGDELPTS